MGDEFLGDLLGLFGCPELGAEIQIVADDRARFLGGENRFLAHGGGAVGKGGEDAAGVQPAGALFLEEFLEVDHARLEVAWRRSARGRTW